MMQFTISRILNFPTSYIDKMANTGANQWHTAKK